MDLYTVGYQGMNIDDFVRNLLICNIQVVADLRLRPVSRKPLFSKARLIKELERHHIEYRHFEELGTPPALRAEVYNTKDYPAFRVKYQKFLTTKGAALQKLHLLCRSQRVALMCFEQDPEKCHRSVVAEAIKDIDRNGLKIRSI